ncbi:MAG: hypothetical protein ACJ8C4_00675 [Gemmataceae bacterium]
MRTYYARLLCAGLGAFFLPACMSAPVRLVPEQRNDAPAQSTVRRIAPEPLAPQQPAMAMAGQQQPIMMQQLGQPIQGANGEWLMPVQIVNAPPQTDQTQTNPTLPAPTPEPPHVVAIHTEEPPLATPQMMQVVSATAPATQAAPPMILKRQPEMPVAPLPTPPNPPRLMTQLAADPGPYPPGYQVLTLQPTPTDSSVKQASYQAPEVVPPQAPPEELKLVTPPKSCVTDLVSAIKSYQDCGMQQANPSEVAEVADQLQQVVTTLRGKAALRIEKLNYCRPGKGARGIMNLPDDHAFHVGESVEVYMELRNFSCESKEQCPTQLATVLEIRNEQGIVVSHFEFQRDRADNCTAPRNDYFHICRFPVQRLNPGQYTLVAKITDLPTGKVAEKALPLTIDNARRTTIRGSAE